MKTAIGIVALAGTAYAQAPGEVPAAAPVPAPAAAAPSGVMADRWSVALALWFGAANPKLDGAAGAGVGGLELAGRFRIRPAIEVALALQAGGGENDTIAVGAFVADFRYHFAPERPWNFVALAGLGVMSVAGKNPTDTEKRARGTLRIGGGVERRFGAWGLEAALRLYAVAQNKDVVVVTPPTLVNNLERYGITGESLTIGASYYF